VLNKALFDFIDLPKLLNVNSITVKLPIVVSERIKCAPTIHKLHDHVNVSEELNVAVFVVYYRMNIKTSATVGLCFTKFL